MQVIVCIVAAIIATSAIFRAGNKGHWHAAPDYLSTDWSRLELVGPHRTTRMEIYSEVNLQHHFLAKHLGIPLVGLQWMNKQITHMQVEHKKLKFN